MEHSPGPGPARRRGTWPRRPGPARRTAPGPDGYDPVSRLEIARAVPAQSKRARGQREWLDALEADELLAELRADRQRNVRKVAQVLARYASWRDRTTRPTRALVCKLAGVAVSTWKAARRWLEDRGYLGTVRGGFVWAWQQNVLDTSELPNEAATYVLCVPSAWRRQNDRARRIAAGQRQTRPLTCERSELVYPAREARTNPGENPGTDKGGRALAVVRHLRAQLGELSRGPARALSDRHLLALGRPMLAAGWSPADLAFAIGHDPVTNQRHAYRVDSVREGAAWVAWRLSRWMRDPDRAWKDYQHHGRWDWSDPASWPRPALSPTARRAAAASADARERARILPGPAHGAQGDPATPRIDGHETRRAGEPSAEWRAVRKSLTNRGGRRG